MPGVRILYEDDTLREGSLRNVHFVAWYDAPTADQMRQYGRSAKAIHDRYPDGSGLMNMVVSGTPRFSSEVRDLARDYTREGLHNVGAAHIILVSGLLGSSVRGFLGTTMLLGRPPNPTKVFGAIDAAARWMAENLQKTGSERWDADALTRAAIELVTR